MTKQQWLAKVLSNPAAATKLAMGNAAINRFEWLKAVTQAEDLPPAAKVIATALSIQFTDNETGQLNPKVTTLADYVKTSVDTVKRAIRALVDAGWLGRTEGRGRGNHTSYTLCSPGKIISFSAQKKGGTSAPLTEKKGALVREKGGTSAPFHYKDKQSSEQKARATGEPPTPHLHAVVHHDGYAEDAWNDWLVGKGYPSLNEIGQPSSDAQGTGWNMPWRTPPNEGDETATLIAEKRVWWLINQRNERARSEVRYAEE